MRLDKLSLSLDNWPHMNTTNEVNLQTGVVGGESPAEEPPTESGTLADFYNSWLRDCFESDGVIDLTDELTAEVSTHFSGLMHLLRNAFYPSGKFDSWEKSLGRKNLKTIVDHSGMIEKEKQNFIISLREKLQKDKVDQVGVSWVLTLYSLTFYNFFSSSDWAILRNVIKATWEKPEQWVALSDFWQTIAKIFPMAWPVIEVEIIVGVALMIAKATLMAMPPAALTAYAWKKVVEHKQHQGVADFLKSERIASNPNSDDNNF